VTFFVK